ncbi:hypothetical protein [Amycolatopsis samaneae]|uniref:Uncharacterized protein n=1 Tax=Amycolatopsis samaneae TaxID=664691 RepID=A0ABW5GTS3_9PSEU
MRKHGCDNVLSLLADHGIDVENVDSSAELEINHFDQWINGKGRISGTTDCLMAELLLEAA